MVVIDFFIVLVSSGFMVFSLVDSLVILFVVVSNLFRFVFRWLWVVFSLVFFMFISLEKILSNFK